MDGLDLVLMVIWAGWLALIALALALCAVSSRADERVSVREPVSATALGAPRRSARFTRTPASSPGAARVS
jgi:hypothetical protein